MVTKQVNNCYWQPNKIGLNNDGFLQLFTLNDSLALSTYVGGQYDDVLRGVTLYDKYIFVAGRSYSDLSTASPTYPLVNLGGVPPSWWQPNVANPALNSQDGVVTRFNLTMSIFSGIREYSAKKIFDDKILVYPNPNNGNFNIKFLTSIKGSVSMTIYNSIGQMVADRNLKDVMKNQEEMFNLDNLTSGIYFINIYSENSQDCVKIIKY
jgi:hypothetical protein